MKGIPIFLNIYMYFCYIYIYFSVCVCVWKTLRFSDSLGRKWWPSFHWAHPFKIFFLFLEPCSEYEKIKNIYILWLFQICWNAFLYVWDNFPEVFVLRCPQKFYCFEFFSVNKWQYKVKLFLSGKYLWRE